MSHILPILIIVVMIGVVGVLATGVVTMVRGGEFNRKYGNKLMRWRIILQFTALMLVLAYFLLHGR